MLGNPTQGPRIVPFGSARLASDRLPNGHPGFRVTQRFSDLDAYFHDHMASLKASERLLALARDGKVFRADIAERTARRNIERQTIALKK